MKVLLFIISLLPAWLSAQHSAEVEFSIEKQPLEKIYLVPNFDTTLISADTLLSGERYYFTLVGIDSASIAKVDFGSGVCKVRSAEGNKAVLDMIPVSYVKGTSTVTAMPLEAPLAIYRKAGNSAEELCFSAVFVVEKRLYNPPPGRVRGRWSRPGLVRRM